MHAMLITFHTSVPVEALQEPFAEYAEGLRSVPGLIAKTWIKDGETLGGFHVFATKNDADRYLGSEMVAALTTNNAFENFTISRYDVLKDLSITNGTPVTSIGAGV